MTRVDFYVLEEPADAAVIACRLAEKAYQRRQRVIGLEGRHRPDDHPQGLQGVFERVKLLEQERVDALTGLVPVPELVAE